MTGRSLESLYDLLGHRFEHPDLLLEALTHPSVERSRRDLGDYDRLEFLGDRVLGLIVAAALFEGDDRAPAGDLAVRFNELVRKETVAEVAREIGLGRHLILSAGEEQVGGRDKTAILGNAAEAVLGALYLDGDLAAARDFVLKRWADRIAAAAETRKDPKTRLQERVQSGDVGPPDYRVVAEEGPAHERRFTVEVTIEDGATATGEGPSKRRAEQAAAAALLENLPADG